MTLSDLFHRSARHSEHDDAVAPLAPGVLVADRLPWCLDDDVACEPRFNGWLCPVCGAPGTVR